MATRSRESVGLVKIGAHIYVFDVHQMDLETEATDFYASEDDPYMRQSFSSVTKVTAHGYLRQVVQAGATEAAEEAFRQAVPETKELPPARRGLEAK